MSNLQIRDKFPVMAVISAIFPGWGQLFKGHFLKAGVIWVATILVGWLFSWWIALPATILWILNILDAFFSNNSEKLLK